MPASVQLGPPRITLAEGTSLFVTSPDGSIDSREGHGFFVHDTRLLSRYRIRVGRRRWTLVSSAPITHYSAAFYFVNPGLESLLGAVRRGTVALTLERTLRGGIHEDLDIANYGPHPVAFPLIIDAGCDFADLFEIRRIGPMRERTVRVGVESNGTPEIHWSYTREDFTRGIKLQVFRPDSPPQIGPHGLTFNVTIPPGGRWHTCLYLVPVIGTDVRAAPDACHGTLLDEMEARRTYWHGAVVRCVSPNRDVEESYRQALDDLAVLSLTASDSAIEHCVVAAGLPWFATLFGRDSLIISLQSLPFTKRFAPAVLRELAALQATAMDDFRDAQPGKILHEIRYGELAHFREIPHTPYYGTADATILYLILLHETYCWTGDRDLVAELLPAAERALRWVDRYGDLDGDGFQEYLRRSPRGIRHQGWKDSFNGVLHADGSPVDGPIALVELQGYAFDAKRRMAALYDAVGRSADASRLRDEAAMLRARFAERFWWPHERTYLFGLDGRKKPIQSVVSNAGHALWSGIAPADQAHAVVRRLMAPDMFSGWGVRTISANHPAYNPFDYQLGAVWPHDNGLIAFGFRRYGHVEEAARVVEGVLSAATCFQSYRLPELFAGLARRPRAFPVQYREANVPQGWAAGSVLMLLQTLLAMRPDAPHGRMLVDPALPEWLPRLELRGISVGRARFDLTVFRDGPETRMDVIVREGSLGVVAEPLAPDDV